MPTPKYIRWSKLTASGATAADEEELEHEISGETAYEPLATSEGTRWSDVVEKWRDAGLGSEPPPWMEEWPTEMNRVIEGLVPPPKAKKH